jgi:murein DD-endopeptidase MepM/ murein hydrolase activator NlpD
MNTHWLLVGLLLLVVIAGGLYMVSGRTVPSVSNTTLTASPETTPGTSTQASFYYPMAGYQERLTNRQYGKSITAADSQGLPCGAPFTGFHDGDDVEVTSDELSKDMPVYAIADGTVRQVGQVKGYGGLLIMQHTLNGQTVTANYGHITVSRTSVKVGDTVKAGQLVTYLGEACSSQTDNERKHLHFAIRQGATIDIKGYVQSRSELQNWLNPLETLRQLDANEPS